MTGVPEVPPAMEESLELLLLGQVQKVHVK
jgi:hypothetical protein